MALPDSLSSAEQRKVRVRAVQRVLWLILIANWVVAAVKGIFGTLGHSTAMTSDALHSAVDGFSNVVALLAIHFSSQPADEEHPYGHHKFEALASLGMGLLVGGVAWELVRKTAAAFSEEAKLQVDMGMVLSMVVTLAINIAVTWWERREGLRLKSRLLLADAQHTLSDVAVSVAVLASLGLSHWGVPRADAWTSFLVIGFVVYAAFGIMKSAVGVLADRIGLKAHELKAMVLAVSGVRSVGMLRSRGLEHSVFVDVEIGVDPALSVAQAHGLAHQVELALKNSVPEISDVVVHVEPAEA